MTFFKQGLVEGYGRTHAVHSIAKAYGVTDHYNAFVGLSFFFVKADYFLPKFGGVILSHMLYLFPYVFPIRNRRYNLIIAFQCTLPVLALPMSEPLRNQAYWVAERSGQIPPSYTIPTLFFCFA